MKTKSALSFQNWKTLFGDTLRAFPKLWWRITAINILMILTIIIGGGVFVGIGYLFFQEALENFVVNLQFGGALENVGWIVGAGAILLLFILVFSINGKIANWLTIKKYTAKKTRNPFSIYFVDVWSYFWRYVGVAFKILWYVGWPLLVVGAIGFGLMHFGQISVLPWGIFVMMLLILWRGLEVFLAPMTLIHSNKKASHAFAVAQKLVIGDWWKVLFFLASFFILISITRAVFFFPDYLINFGLDFSQNSLADYGSRDPQIYAPSFLILLDVVFSFLVLSPLMMIFPYLLMLYLSKVKKIKL